MATLSNGRDPPVKLRTLHSVGRSSLCDLCLPDPRVSVHHAELRWSGVEWEVVDLASTNGTWIDGRRIPPRERTPLGPEREIRFGGAESAVWRLVDASAPACSASSGDLHVEEVGGMLILPAADDDDVLLYRSAAGEWVLEQAGEVGPAPAGDVLHLGGRAWRLDLGPPAATDGGARGRSVHDAELVFVVSADEEYTELRVRHHALDIELGSLSCFYTLLSLARRRLGEAEAGGSEAGWVDVDDLAHRLRTRETQVNLDVHRIRQRFAAAGFLDAAQIVERRRYRKQLRIGTARIMVRRAS